jgi:hypothetical protein
LPLLSRTQDTICNLPIQIGAVGQESGAITPEGALVALGRITYLYTTGRDGQRRAHLPRPDAHQSKILEAIGLSFPSKPKALKLVA